MAGILAGPHFPPIAGPIVRRLGLQPYPEVFAAMRAFTEARTPETADELWLLEHPPVFTQGQAGRPEHVLAPGAIPVVQSNRGGQVTYHGPGQWVVYVLLDLHRRGYGVKSLVTRLERATIATLAACGIAAQTRTDAPGVYVRRASWPDGRGDEIRKIGSLGLRVSRGRSYHGLSLNVDMDLEPFSRIEPCGLRGLRMTQVRELLPESAPHPTIDEIGTRLTTQLCIQLAPGEPAGSTPIPLGSPTDRGLG